MEHGTTGPCKFLQKAEAMTNTEKTADSKAARVPGALTAKQARFVEEYLVDLNASAAARRAGYSARTAEWQGPQLLGKPHVAAAVAAAVQARSARTQITADDVLRQWVTIATANPADLVRYRVRACRHCHGVDHAWQWVSQAEWLQACARAEAEGRPSPSDAGGFGFSVALRPVATCHHCLGDGVTDVLIPDTRDLSPAAARLYAGVKQTKEGIEVKMRDQDGALANVARHLGMFTDRLELAGKGGGPVQTVNMTPAEFRAIAAELAGKV